MSTYAAEDLDDVAQLKALIASQHYEEARVLSEAYARGAGRLSPAFLAAVAALRLAEGKTDEATEMLGKLNEAGHLDADGLANLATCHRTSLRNDEALACIDAALSLEPDEVRFMHFKAEVLLELSDIEGARALLKRLPDGDANTWMISGNLAFRAGDPWEANRCFRRAADIDRKNPDIWVNIASVEAALGRGLAAVAAAGEAYRRAPASVDVMVMYGWRLIDAGDVSAAETILKRASALAPQSVAVHAALASARVLAGVGDAALVELTRIVRALPKDVPALVGLGRVLHLCGRLEHASALADEAKNLAPDATLVRSFRADCLLGQARFADLWGAGERDAGLAGKILLVPSSMPVPEVVLALRFVSALAVDGNITVLAPPFLRPLLSRVSDLAVNFVEEAASDHVEELPYLPSRLHGLWAARPRVSPYLTPADDRAQVWRTAFSALQAPAIGIVWRARDRTLGREPLTSAVRAAFPNARLLNFTVEVADVDARGTTPPDDALLDAAPHLTDHDELLAAVAGLDLLIGVDSLAAHLAGAVGARGLVLVRPGRHWAWAARDGASLWYPTLQVAELPHGPARDALQARLAEFAAQVSPLSPRRTS